MMSCTKNKFPNEPIYLVITRGADIGKTFTLMLLIQALIFFIKYTSSFKPFKKESFAHDIY
jgi:hypothetical protein